MGASPMLKQGYKARTFLGRKREWVDLKVTQERVRRLPEPVGRIGHRTGSRDRGDPNGKAPEQREIQGAATRVHSMPVFVHGGIPDMKQTLNGPVTPNNATELLRGGI